MLLERFDEPKLAQRSYLIACIDTSQALVIDPNRDVDQYVKAAEAAAVRITHVAETHIHADFISGSRELAERTGATLYLSHEGDASWQYAFADAAGAALLKDGDSFDVGSVRITVWHTPGHTPEHLTFFVTDTASATEPIGAVTGDFVFVGDVGRPDLLEWAAQVRGSADGAARALFRSLQRFKTQPEYLQIWPGHGAGSACGKEMSSVPHSTVGYERRFNWAFSVADEDEFVRAVLLGQPEPPKYFAEMKRLNQEGPRILGGFRRAERLAGGGLRGALEAGSLVIDTRSAASYGAGHIPGTINIPLNDSFTTWAGWLVPYGRDFYLIVDDSCTDCTDEAVKDLAMIGLDRVAGYFGSEVIAGWRAGGRALESVPRLSVDELAQRLPRGDVLMLDVRGRSEWETGHVPGSLNIPVGYLTDRLDELPRDRPVVVHCQGGGRSAIAASVLRASGLGNVLDLTGGFARWQSAGHPVE